MTNSTNTSARATIKKLVVIYGVVSALVLVTVASVAIGHGSVSLFMWIRAAVLLLAAPVIYSWAARWLPDGVQRLRTVSLVLPIAIVVVDFIPGVCPVWYAALQAISAVALVPVAILSRRGSLGRTSTRAN